MNFMEVMGLVAVLWLGCGTLTWCILGIRHGMKKPEDWYIGIPVTLLFGPIGLYLIWSERS